MTKFHNVNSIRPFGPTIFECDCPEEVLKKLNFIVESTPNQSPPNLLDRDFEIVFFTQKQVDDSGFTSFIREVISDCLETWNMENASMQYEPSSFSDLYVDVWANRYFKADWSPPHNHKGIVSGVTILKLPEESDDSDLHNLNFIWNNEHHTPLQEIGKTFMFPSTLLHWVRKTKTVSERRTLSFNLSVFPGGNIQRRT